MEPLVTVCLITYNQTKYVRQAIESVLKQRVNFSMKLFIADDFSTDGTREIILSYKDKFPNFIELIFQKSNVGPANNFIELISKPKSKYIAYLEGDDYWTDPLKLQKQVDYLESNTDIAGCFHDVCVVDEDGALKKDNYYVPPKDLFDQSDCVKLGSAYCTGALMFRSLVVKKMPGWFLKSPSDYAIDLLITEFGKIAHLHERMGAYRIHNKGIWQGKQSFETKADVIKRYRFCLSNPKFEKEYGRYFKKGIGEISADLAMHYKRDKQFGKVLKYTWFYVYYGRPKNLQSFHFLVGILLFPGLYKKIKFLFWRR